MADILHNYCMTSIAIAGATGYAGGEILRLILSHPKLQSGELKISALTAANSSGTRLGEYHGHLFPLQDYIVDPTDPQLLASADILFCALPHGTSANLIKQLPDSVMVIDCGADYRLNSADQWKKYYGTPYAGHWPYGLPELPGQREHIRNTKKVAVPGCFPTATLLALYPAAQKGLIRAPITITAITGTSGAGKNPQIEFTASEVIGALRPYSIAGQHRHIPEIEQNLEQITGISIPVIFTPVIAPIPRGILAVCTTQLADEYRDISTQEVLEIYKRAYTQEPFVHVNESLPNTAHVLGSNIAEISAHIDPQYRSLTLIGAIDNLIKGTAGTAIQNMNLLLGYPETSGLPITGTAP